MNQVLGNVNSSIIPDDKYTNIACESKLNNYLRIKAQLKLKILSRHIHAQMLFDIKLYDLPLTWIEQNLDTLSAS